MPNYRFVQINFTFPGVPKVRDLEFPFNALGDDWIRTCGTNWIVWTGKETHYIRDTLLPFIDQQDSLIITSIHPSDISGRMPPWVWTWFNSKAPGTVYVPFEVPPPPATPAIPPSPPPPWLAQK